MTSKRGKFMTEGTAVLSNKRRGWYRIFPVTLGENWDPAAAETSLAAGDTLVLLEILIPGEDIKEQEIQGLCDVFSFFIQKKMDMILRFSYDFEGKGREKDPSSLAVVEQHMRQIAPVLNAFSEHIFVLQGIFLGSWGEMHSSRYLTKDNIQKLENILREILSPKIYRSVRKPVHWRIICSEEEELLSEQENIGLYNDGMFGSVTDLGTFAKPDSEREYGWEETWPKSREQEMIARHARYAPHGGEVIAGQTLTSEEILFRLRKEGITYLNRDYDKTELERWKGMDCGEGGVWQGHSLYDYVEAHMGYRFVVQNGRLCKRFHRSILTLEIENTGFAAPYEEIFLELVEGSLEEPRIVAKQVLADPVPGKRNKIKIVSGQKEFGKNCHITLRDAKGNSILCANEGAAEGIPLSLFC